MAEWEIDITRAVKDTAERALDEYEYKGHTIKEWADKITSGEYQPDKGWISVEERLPEIKEHYRSELVICYSPDGEHECLFDYYEMNGFGQGCFTAEKYFGITITHWQPLPEPPNCGARMDGGSE